MSFETALGAPVVAQTPAQGSIPDLRGTWKGESESVVFGAGAHPHHGGAPREDATLFTSKPFTMTIDKQDGRRFSGTFSSERHSETLIGVVSRSGTIFMVDDDGMTSGRCLRRTGWRCVISISQRRRGSRPVQSSQSNSDCISGRPAPASNR